MTRRFRMIACEVNRREVCAAVARSRNVVDADFLPKGLHDVGKALMSARLQEALNVSPRTEYEAVLLWYGLCNNGVCGLRAAVPLVVPRAHDCITLMLGSRVRYAEYFEANPGTFYQSPGWIERDSDPNDNPASVTARLGLIRDFRALAERYGEENAGYLMPNIADWFKHYRKAALIDTGVGDVEEYRARTRKLASERNWAYEELKGDAGLLDRMMAGDWDAGDFLIVPPGRTFHPTFGPDIIETE